ncbi:MAG: hypothetical protein HRU28_17905 [Rhizobiales bacterium]|nr:hypothetical protein [Hyphomicrobiales bacterium]
MPITLNKAIIHELVKEQREAIQPSAIREHVLPPNNPSIIELIEGIVGLYGKKNSSAQYGVFKSGEGKGQFPESFENYHAAALTDESFKKVFTRFDQYTSNQKEKDNTLLLEMSVVRSSYFDKILFVNVKT